MRRHEPSASASSLASPATLPECLARWAVDRPQAIALRHKTLGVWVAWTWGDLQEEVERVGATLDERGFEPGDIIVIASGPTPQALAVTLAAQGLGGAAVWVDPTDAREGDGADEARAIGAESMSLTMSRARFGFARDEAALGDLRARIGLSGPWALGLFTAEHGSPQEGPAAALRAYADAVAGDGGPRQPPPSRARPSDAAVHVLGRAQSLTHAALVAAARAWLEANEIGAGHRAFTWEAPTTEAAAIFIASWLAGGISLTLPEDLATADADRREDQPTIVAATAGAYERLWQQIADNLPAPGTWLRRAVDAGLASAAGERVRRAFGAWMVRRPLRKVIGFGRAGLAVVLDAAPPSPAAQALFARLGVPLRALSPGSSAEMAGPAARFSPPAADHAPLFEARLAAGKLT